MQPTRRLLALAALALGTTLAACSDSGTAPQQQDEDPLVARLNRAANGQGRVLSVRKKDVTLPGVPEGMLKPQAALQPCYETIDGDPCGPYEPYDPTCYSNCSWFDVDAYVAAGWLQTTKYATLEGNLYAYAGSSNNFLSVYFYGGGSVSGCTSNPPLFDSTNLSGGNGPLTLGASRYIEYNGGVFSWAVYVDGWSTNQYGREGNETDYASTCF